MRLLTFILVLLLCVSFKKEEPETILWQEEKLLTWDDFRGKPEKRFAAASTHYDIIKELQDNSNSANINIKAIFFCKRSWKKKSWINESVLRHEQKHFDIVELFARKLRKLIFEQKYLDYNDVKIKTDSLYTIIDKEMDVYQDKYDEETDGSMNGDKQREWEPKIMTEIKKLDTFKNTELKLSFSKK